MSNSSSKVADSKSTRVGVVARVRPLLDGEPSERCIDVEEGCIVLHQPDCPTEDQYFTFDRCYSDTASQDALFEAEVAPIVKSTAAGFNGTVFCYGVTGSGKTYTMDGVLPRTAEACLAIPNLKLFASYFEILNERVHDLLDPSTKELQVREKDGRVMIPGATEQPIECSEQFGELQRVAISRRATAHTNSNTGSHAVLRLRLQVAGTAGVLNLIDLAGSEDNRVTGNTGARLVESSNINRSLFNLGKVIDALNKKAKHIPYRESKLTRVLQDSLGGGAHTLMIVNLPPGVPYYHHVLNTLQFAAKSRNIVNKPVVVQHNPPAEPSMAEKLAAFREKKGTTPAKLAQPQKRKLSSIVSSPACPLKHAKLTLSGAIESHYEPATREPLAPRPPNEFGLSDGGALLLTPQAKLKQARALVSKAMELESKGDSCAALKKFEAAAKLVPTDKLNSKITQMGPQPIAETPIAEKMASPEPVIQQTKAIGAGKEIRDVLESGILDALNSGCDERVGALKDIGPKRQFKVQQWVAQNGGFSSVAQLSEIGMSQKQVENFLKRNVVW